MSGTPRFIVTTSISPPTQAIETFDALPGWTLIVVGDKATPEDYKLRDGIYLSPREQHQLAPELSDLIGWNCIQRRNLGFVLALELGAEVIASVDDDNIPYESWGDDLLLGSSVELPAYDAPNGCFDPIGATEHKHLWHRGYPLQLVSSRDYSRTQRLPFRVDVQADFWDGDPDVDAVCRMEHAPDVTFGASPFPFTSSAIAPFNSQNTFFTREALAHYFVLPGVGRMDDIWASFHLQSLGYRVAFSAPSVRQIRNEHDLTEDLVNEFIGYERNAGLVRSINEGSYEASNFWPARTCAAYAAYRKRISA